MNSNQHINPLGASILSRAFSSSVLIQIAKSGKSRLLTALTKESGLNDKFDQRASLANCYELIYSQLQFFYRNEYVYKNVIANKILLGRHSLNTANMHTEFRVGDSKADILILNGTSHIYEIKTELDSLERLDGQIKDYIRFSEFVSIVASEKHIDKLLVRAPSSVGIICLTDKGRLKNIRKAVSGKANLSRSLIFDSLQKNEYLQIINDSLGITPDVSNTEMYTECKKIFETIEIHESHEFIVSVLKARNMNSKTKELIVSVPECLKAAATSLKLTKLQQRTFLDALDSNLSECIYN